MNRINYHVAFAELQEALRHQTKVENVKGKEKRAGDAAKLLLAATDIYKDEEARSKAVLPHLTNVLQKTMIGRSRKEFQIDPMVIESINDDSYEQKGGIIGYIYLKNEIGSTGDGGVQCALALREHLIEEKVYTP